MIDVRTSMAVLWGILLVALPARSQQEGAAESLFRQGREQMKRGEPHAACPKFEESYRLDPSIGTLLNLSLCEEALGHTATAWTKLRQFLDAAPDGDSRLHIAREHVAALEAQLPWVHLVVVPGLRPLVVELDGIELRDASLGEAIPVNPGPHVVRVTLASGESKDTAFQIRAAEKLELQVPLPARQSPQAVVTSPDPPASSVTRSAPPVTMKVAGRAPTASDDNAERAIGYGLGAIGVAGAVTGTVFGLLALNDKSGVHEHCPNHECQDQIGLDAVQSGARNVTVSNVAFVVGAFGLVTGGAFLWHSQRTRAALTVGTNSASFAFIGVIP